MSHTERALPYEIHGLRKTPQYIDATHRSFTYGEFSNRKKNWCKIFVIHSLEWKETNKTFSIN